jgi:hypothetical protein
MLRAEEWMARRDRERAKREKRTVPMGDAQRGHCRWCARPILATKGKHIGQPDPRRSWCRSTDPSGRDCYFQYLLHSNPQTQFNWLERNRGLVCARCGIVDPRRWRAVGDCAFWESRIPEVPWTGRRRGEAYIQAMIEHRRRCIAEFPMWGQGTLIERQSMLVVDHVEPLWRVLLTVPLEGRRPYFGPDNLQLLCEAPCHKEKTRREATERAELRRLIASGDGERIFPIGTASAAG